MLPTRLGRQKLTQGVFQRGNEEAAWREGRGNAKQKEQMAMAQRCTQEGGGAGCNRKGRECMARLQAGA